MASIKEKDPEDSECKHHLSATASRRKLTDFLTSNVTVSRQPTRKRGWDEYTVCVNVADVESQGTSCPCAPAVTASVVKDKADDTKSAARRTWETFQLVAAIIGGLAAALVLFTIVVLVFGICVISYVRFVSWVANLIFPRAWFP